MNKSECYLLGYVVRPSGVKGEIVVETDVDDLSRYKKIDAIFVDMQGDLVPFFVKGVKIIGTALTLAIDGFDGPDQAKMLVKCSVYLPLAALPVLDDKRFYFHEISGFEVIDARFGVVGIAEEVMDRFMQPVLKIRSGKNEVMIPISENAIQKVDRANKKLYVTSPEGLIEIYLNPEEGDEEFIQPEEGDE